MRIAIDAIGATTGTAVVVDGALVAARHLQVGLLLVGDGGAIEAELSRHPAARGIDLQIVDAPERVEMARAADGGAAPQAEGLDPRRGRSGPRWAGAHALFSAGHTGASVMARSRGVRPAARPRPSGAWPPSSRRVEHLPCCSIPVRAWDAARRIWCSSR